MATQQDWVKMFRKSVKDSCPKGWLVMKGRTESMRVQCWTKGNRIADVTIPYSWSESDWPNALLRIKTAAKAYEESDRKLDIKTCFAIAHTSSSDNPTDWREALKAYRQSKGKKLKESTWETKYMPVLIEFKHDVIDNKKVYEYEIERNKKGTIISKKKIPLSISNIEQLAVRNKNGKSLCKAALKRWEQGTTQHRHMRLALYGFLRFCVEEMEFESKWLPPAVTDQDQVRTEKRIGYPLTDLQIIRLLESFSGDEAGNKWKFAFQLMATYGLRPEDLRYVHTRNGGNEIWSNYQKSMGGTKGLKTKPRRLYPLFVEDVDGAVNWNLKERLYISEQQGKSLLPPLGQEGKAGGAFQSYLKRKPVWNAIKKEIEKEQQELTPYSFRHRYAYVAHNRSKPDGTYRAAKKIADAMGHTLDTHLLSYSRFNTKDLASDFDEVLAPVREKV